MGALAKSRLQRHGVAMHMKSFHTNVPSNATLAEQIMSGNSVVTSDWVVYLDKSAKIAGKGIQSTVEGNGMRLLYFSN